MSHLVESIDQLLEDSFSTGAFRMGAKKFAPQLASKLGTKVQKLAITDEHARIDFADGTYVDVQPVFRQRKTEFRVDTSWSNGRYFTQWLDTVPKMFADIQKRILRSIKTKKDFKPSVELVRGAPSGSVGIQVTHKLGRMASYTARKNGSKFDIWHGARAKAPSLPGEIIATVSSMKDAKKAALNHALAEADSLRGLFSFGPSPEQKRAQAKTTAKRKYLKKLRQDLDQAEFALEFAETDRARKKIERQIARIKRDLSGA